MKKRFSDEQIISMMYERLPVCKASVVLTLTSSCSSVSGLTAVRAAGHYEIRWPDPYSPCGLYAHVLIQVYQVTVLPSLSSLGPPSQPFSIHPFVKSLCLISTSD